MYKETLHGLRHVVRCKTSSRGHGSWVYWRWNGEQHIHKGEQWLSIQHLRTHRVWSGMWVELRGRQNWPPSVRCRRSYPKFLFSIPLGARSCKQQGKGENWVGLPSKLSKWVTQRELRRPRSGKWWRQTWDVGGEEFTLCHTANLAG